jgi:serine/threonine protein kinase
LKGRVDKGIGAWKKITPVAKDLLKRLLETNMSKRMTADQALNHPWFKQVTQAIIDVDPIIIRSLRTHKLMNRMHKEAM